MQNEGHEAASTRLKITIDPTGAMTQIQGHEALRLIDIPEPGELLLDRIHQDDHEAMKMCWSWVKEQPGRTITLHHRFLRGYEWWIQVNSCISFPAPDTVLLEFDFDEAASRKLAEIQMRDIVEQSTNGVIVLGESGPLYTNNGYARLVGYESIEALVRSGEVSVTGHIHEDDLEMMADRITRRLAGDVLPSQYEFRLRRKSGDIIWVEANVSVIEWDGQVASLSWLTDISARKETQEEIAEYTAALTGAKMNAELASKAKSDFLANMSHELRTPLNAIIGFSEIMSFGLYGDLGHAKYDDYVAMIKRSGDHLLAIIDDILDLSKVEAGKVELLEQVCNINDTVSQSLTVVETRAQLLEMTLNYSVPDNFPNLHADQRLVNQVLFNALSNAIKFNKHNSPIEVEARLVPETGQIAIDIRDQGKGMSEDELEFVLQPFNQVGDPMSRTSEGTGLGLPLMSAFMKLHGGTLEISSIKGSGTCVTLLFPAERSLPHSPDPVLDPVLDKTG